MVYPLLDRCIQAAAHWHAGAERDGPNPLPYVTHPVEVLTLLHVVGGIGEERMLCAAALHDVLEESDARPEDVESLAGQDVLALVQELTRSEPSAEEIVGMTKSEVWKLRALRLLDEIARMSRDAQTIKLADRLSNVREAKRTKPPAKLDRYLWQTRRILEVVPRDTNSALWDAIERDLR